MPRRLYLNRASFVIARQLEAPETIGDRAGEPGDYVITLPGADRETLMTRAEFDSHYADIEAEAERLSADDNGNGASETEIENAGENASAPSGDDQAPAVHPDASAESVVPYPPNGVED